MIFGAVIDKTPSPIAASFTINPTSTALVLSLDLFRLAAVLPQGLEISGKD